MKTQVQNAVNLRYSDLAETSCCLSCGGAVTHGNASKGEICIDLGSGRGTDVLRMAEDAGPEGFVYGFDISGGMIEKAKKQAHKLGIENVSFIKADLENLPLEDVSADLVISNCTINHVENKQAVWNEIYRVLKPGGRFVVSDIYSTLPVPELYRKDPEAVAECWAGSVTREEYSRELSAAGFTDVEILEESEPYPKGSIEVVSWTLRGVKPQDAAAVKNT